MKKLFLFLIPFFLFSLNLQGQNDETKRKMKAIEGEWEVDEDGLINFTRIVEVDSLSKEEIYVRALAYFTYNYKNGEDAIQVAEKEAGTIISKGLYDDLHVFSAIIQNVHTWYILRIDIKEGRARIILSLTEYRVELNKGLSDVEGDYKISNFYPVNKKGNQKNLYGKAFYESNLRVRKTLDSLEKAIKEGIGTKNKNDDW